MGRKEKQGKMPKSVRIVDLFCGCGGLSLGFELYRGEIHYQTVMALDNDPAPIRCYNANHPRRNGGFPTARLCDVTWFSHPSEVLLYYLTHLALWGPDPELLKLLKVCDIGLQNFLAHLYRLDRSFEEDASALVNSTDYREALGKVDPDVFKLAICRAALGRLGIISLKTLALTPEAIPWREESEISVLSSKNIVEPESFEPVPVIENDLHDQWDAELVKLKDAAGRKGRGQHSVVAPRLQTLIEFLADEGGKKLKAIWIKWRSRRDSTRATYCTRVQEALLSYYSKERRVHLILGGPPCKGFSRIGRAVVESLRDQGVHAWTSREYGDERNALLHKYVLFLEALKPDAFIFENVAHFASALKTPAGKLEATSILSEAIEELSESHLRFNIGSRVIKARRHAIPQDRERFIMMGVGGASASWDTPARFFDLADYEEDVPLQSALQGLEKPGEFSSQNRASAKPDHTSRAYTMADPNMPTSHLRYIHWIRQPAPGTMQAPSLTDAHVVRKPRADDLALIRKFAPGQRWMDYKIGHSQTLHDLRSVLEKLLSYMDSGSVAGLPSSESLKKLLDKTDNSLFLRLLLEEISTPLDSNEAHHLLSNGYLKKGGDQHGDWFERLSASRPSKTIVAHIGKDTYGYIHPYEDRALSIREAARIQSFPDFFLFGSVGVVNGYSIIGNAVPPLLANEFAARLAAIDAESGVFDSKGKKEAEVESISRRSEQLALDLPASQ